MTAKEQGLPEGLAAVKIADILNYAGWRAIGDAQWTRLASVIPELRAALASDTGERGVVRVLCDFFFDADNQQHIPTLTVEFEPVKVGVPTNEAKGFQDRDRLAAAIRAQPAGGGWFCPTCDESVPSHHVTFNETHDERAGGCGKDVVGSGDALTQPDGVDRD